MRFKATVFLTAAAILSAGAVYAIDAKDEGLAVILRANSYAAEIIDLRSSLSRSFIKPGADITEETFKGVCGAVAKRVKELSEQKGITIRHAASRFRNPKNAATAEEEKLLKKFADDKKLSETQEDMKKDGKAYLRYTRPIYVEDSCLACHGPKEKRPQFIVEKYPEDRAYGFAKGDLRGIITILAPKK